MLNISDKPQTKKWPVFIFESKPFQDTERLKEREKTGAEKGGPVCIAEMSDVEKPGQSL